MTASDLARSATSDSAPPAGLSTAACALWYAKAGRWDESHNLCQEVPGNAGSWIHAWLHRQEGDLGNAAYWYSRAGKPSPFASVTLEEEWFQIATELTSINS